MRKGELVPEIVFTISRNYRERHKVRKFSAKLGPHLKPPSPTRGMGWRHGLLFKLCVRIDSRVTIDTLEELADSVIGCGGWGEQSREFFITSLDVASQKVGRKFEIIYDVDSAVERVASGEFAYYENVHYLHYLTVKHKDINVISRYNETEGNIIVLLSV